MDQDRYREIVERYNNGEIVIGVEPALARKFFTDTDKESVRQEFGESFNAQRLIVKSVWILEYITLIFLLISSIISFKWYSILLVTIIIISAIFYGGKSSIGRQGIGGNVLFAIICFGISYKFIYQNIYLSIWFLLLPMPYLFARLTYKLSNAFLRSISMRNQELFSYLIGKAIFLKE